MEACIFPLRKRTTLQTLVLTLFIAQIRFLVWMLTLLLICFFYCIFYKRAIEYFYMEVNMEMTEVNVYTFISKVVCCKRHM